MTASTTDTMILDILVMGLGGSGKTTLMQTISETTEQQNDWHTGKLMVDDSMTLNFLEPPAHRSFDFLWMRELVSTWAVPGYIVMFDCTTPEYFGEAISILQTIRAYHDNVPCVVAANKQDCPEAWTADDVRIGLGIPDDIPVVPCVAGEMLMVREVIIQLLYKIFERQELA